MIQPLTPPPTSAQALGWKGCYQLNYCCQKTCRGKIIRIISIIESVDIMFLGLHIRPLPVFCIREKYAGESIPMRKSALRRDLCHIYDAYIAIMKAQHLLSLPVILCR